MKKKIVVASKNPVKLETTLDGFKNVFPDCEFEVLGVSVPSGVSDQPLSESDTLKGATNRVNNAMHDFPEANYWVGIEGGLHEVENKMLSFAWIVISDGKKYGKGRSATFILPDKLSQLVKQGMELGDADDIVFGLSNSKQQNGAVGILTKNLITRKQLYSPAVILALIPFVNSNLF